MFKMGHSKNAYYIFVGTKVQQKNGICKFWSEKMGKNMLWGDFCVHKGHKGNEFLVVNN